MKSRLNALLEELRELHDPIAWDICVNEFPAVCKNYPDGIPIYDEDHYLKELHPVENLEEAICRTAKTMESMSDVQTPRDLWPWFLGVHAGYSVIIPDQHWSPHRLTDTFMATLSRRDIRELHSLNYMLLRHLMLSHLEEEALGQPVIQLTVRQNIHDLFPVYVQWDLVLFREAELLYVHCLANGLILPRYIVRRDEKLGWLLECLDHEIPESLSTPGWIPKTIRRF